VSTSGGGLPAWRFASRLARREVRRRPGRTLLVTILVALPVLAMTIGSVMARTGGIDTLLRSWKDGTDLELQQAAGSTVDLSGVLPEGSTASTMLTATLPIETSSGDVIDEVSVAGGVDAPPPQHVYRVTGGRAPGAGEVWLSRPLAEQLDLGVGDELVLQHPRGTWTVSGIGRVDVFDRRVAIVDVFPLDQFRRSMVTQTTAIDLPGNPSEVVIGEVASAVQAQVRADGGSNVMWPNSPNTSTVDGAGLAWGWVAGVIALATTGVIIAAAFATSARRQLVTIGLLSANGGSQQLTRRVLALQGFWTGVIGSVSGVAVGLVALVAGRSTIEHVVGHVLAPYQFAVADLIVIALTGVTAGTVAALIPARTAIRVPVIAALGGRRPQGAVPRRLVPIGLGLFAGGIFLLVVAASTADGDGGDATAAAAVVGGLLVLTGACFATPLAIDVMSRMSAAVGRSWRFAGRSVGRTRSRSAAVVTAIAVTGAAACAGSSVALATDDDSGRDLPADAVVITANTMWPATKGARSRTVDFEPLPDLPLDADMQRAVDAVVAEAAWFPIRLATWDAAPFRDGRGPRTRTGAVALSPDVQFVIADPAVEDLYELNTADREALEKTGVLMLNPWAYDYGVGRDGRPDKPAAEQIHLATENGDLSLAFAPREWVAASLSDPAADSSFDGVRGVHAFMITEDAARRAGLTVVTGGAFLRAGSAITPAQRNQIYDLVFGPKAQLGFFYRDLPNPESEQSTWGVMVDGTERQPSRTVIQGAVTAAALLLTLLVVAIGLSLAATESRDERDVLVAVGARPGTMRRMAGAKATVITLTGALLAVPTGLIPLVAVLRTLDEPFHIPWLTIGGLILVIPAIAGLAAWAVSSVAQRARPVRMSTLAFE
jgi:putative ABC transport system permease protein